jgi:hypothetical protein
MLKLPVIKCDSTTNAALYQTGVALHAIVPWLLTGHDPRSQNWNSLPPVVQHLYLKLQRKTTKARREDAKAYVINRMSPRAKWIGAFPALVIGMPLSQEFKSLGDEDFEQMGVLKVRNDLKHPNVVLDGLGRLTAHLDTLEEEGLDLADWSSNITVPVTIIAGNNGHTLTEEEMGQLFQELNTLQEPVSKGQAIDLDRSDLYVIATNDVGALDIIQQYGGMDNRAVSIGKNSDVWTTKTILLKAVRAAAEGPGGHVDHVRDKISNAWLRPDNTHELIERFEESLITFVDAVGGVPDTDTLLRTAAWWVAFGLVLHDLYDTYEGATISDQQRERFLRRMGTIDWGLGNPEFQFLGSSVQEKERKTGEFKPKPVDEQGREVINRFYGGSKAYYNLAGFIRQKIDLRDSLPSYGSDYGASVTFDEEGHVILPSDDEREAA